MVALQEQNVESICEMMVGEPEQNREAEWGKKCQGLIWLGKKKQNKAKNPPKFHGEVCDWDKVPEFSSTGVRMPPSLCSPLGFDKFDINLLSTESRKYW